MEILIVGGGYIAPGRERLRAYIESNLEWMAESRAQIVALLAIFNAVPYSAGGQPAAYAGHYQIVIARLEDCLREGQRTAELRAFPAADGGRDDPGGDRCRRLPSRWRPGLRRRRLRPRAGGLLRPCGARVAARTGL